MLKSPFLSVNRSPIHYGFCGSTEATGIWYSVNTAEVCSVILQTHFACLTVSSFPLHCHNTKSIIHANRIYHLALSSALPLRFTQRQTNTHLGHKAETGARSHHSFCGMNHLKVFLAPLDGRLGHRKFTHGSILPVPIYTPE